MVDLNDSIWNTRNSPSDRSGVEDSQSRGGRTRKKLQKSPLDQSQSLQRANGASAENSEAQEKGNTRRKPSIRNYKTPMGARPLTRSPSKPSNAPDTSRSTRTAPLAPPKPFSRSRQSSSANPPRQLATNAQIDDIFGREDRTQTAPFLPEVNFDDLHTSITGETDLYDLAASKSALDNSTVAALGRSQEREAAAPTLMPTEKRDFSATRIGRSNSLLRKQSSTAPKPQLGSRPNASNAIENPASGAARTRRQSHFPSSISNNNLSRAPRKSIGPGVLPHSASDYSFLRRELPKRIGNSNVKVDQGNETGLGEGLSAYDSEGAEASGRVAGKSKSTHTPRKTGAEHVYASTSTPEDPWASVESASSRSPLRNSHIGITTPSSGKRLSVMPGHATGLGARTISPTDARRMKRMSIMPIVPPVPSTPPASLPDANVFDSRMAVETNTQAQRKVDTPVSSRTTPDPSRKSISSAISISSNTSLNSFRLQNINLTRTHQNNASSRLPTLKGRNEAATTGTEEGVPPVPAIPKAYESPKNEQDISFAVARKSSLQFDAISTASTSTNDYASAASTNSSEKEANKAERERDYRPRKGMTLNNEPQDDRASGAQNGRRTLQPIRLPPLNLLPLSTPTADKIAALADTNASEPHGPSTPPPKRAVPQTPSTPMTASKASFSRFPQREDSSVLPSHLRTSSSHYNLKSETRHSRIPSGSTANLTSSIDFKPPRKAVSPYLSTSLPKSHIEFNSTRSKPVGDRSISTFGVDSKPIKPVGPRAQTGKPSKTETIETSGALTDTESSSFGSTLRRKLSLTRKRSSSKNETERPPQPPDHEVMPPPKLPASATWTGPWHPNDAPTQRPTYLHSRRKSTLTENSARPDRTRSEAPTGDGAVDQSASQKEAQPRVPAARTASGNVPTMSKLQMLSNRGVSRQQTVNTELDKDDLIAEEEMKKLAHKRKSAENAAKELDELKRRAIPKDCVTPLQALRAARLNIFERGEIMDFKDIYFCGTQTAKKIEGNAQGASSNNFGYDDERGDYNIILGDHLEYRYEVVDVLGKGSFGQVVRCIDHKTGQLVAIKIIRNKKRFHQQALVEVNILQKLRDWDPQNKYSMVNFTSQFYFRGHLCISTELLGMNLYEFIKLHDFKGFSLKLIRRFTKQMLNSLLLLQSHRIIHCDLKPENILLAHPAHSEIKVIDFGSSCHENERVYTYIQSRFYRSPEVVLGMTYGMAIDMWSLGCILAELLTGYPIFPGENEQEQLACIMEVFGPPDKQLIEKATRKKLFFDSLGKPRLTVSSKGKRRRPSSRTLQQALKCDDEPFLDFLTKCLRWDPERRMKPDEAIHHEFITGIKQAPPMRTLRPLPQSTTGPSTSPIKRFNSLHTPSSAVRPLPEPPATALRNGVSTKPRDGLNGSPSRPAAKRHSTVSAITNGIGSNARKGSGTVTGLGSIPKLEGRLATGGSVGRTAGRDLASAAAAAATTVSSTSSSHPPSVSKLGYFRRKSMALIERQKTR